ncbi:hypothetical protein QUF76_00770 [Desulfobacterales bacterium HSG16]|nr:hypothetical protein [Desulfobacterales bacterium HSG16]
MIKEICFYNGITIAGKKAGTVKKKKTRKTDKRNDVKLEKTQFIS